MSAKLTTFKDFVYKAIDVLNSVIPLLFIIATVVFLWGILQFIMSGDNKEKREDGKQFIIYGLIGLFVMVAVWGLVAILTGTFFKPGELLLPSGPTL